MTSSVSFENICNGLKSFCLKSDLSCPLQLLLTCLRVDAQHRILNSKKICDKLNILLQSCSPSEQDDLFIEFPSLQKISIRYESNKVVETLHKNMAERSFYKFTKFSKSQFWTNQIKFYERFQMNAWDYVPYQISSNGFVARYYCSIIDKIVAEQSNTMASPTVRVIEVGAGHGRLSCLMALELRKFRDLTKHL